MFQLKGGLHFDSGLHDLVPYAGLLMWLATGGEEMPLRFERMKEPDGTFERLDARTAIEGLWLTGQDTVTCGQPIVQGAGLITAFRILGLRRSLLYLARTVPPIVRSLLCDRSRADEWPDSSQLPPGLESG